MSAEQFQFKILTTGRAEVDKREPCNLRPLNLEKLLKWIDHQPTEQNIKIELKKSASAYPHQALGAWQKNYSKHVATAQAKLRKMPKPKLPVVELGDEPLENYNEKRHENYKDIKSSFDTIANEFEPDSGGDQG